MVIQIDSSTVFEHYLPYWLTSPGSIDLVESIPDIIEFEVDDSSAVLLTKLPDEAGRRYAEGWADQRDLVESDEI